MVNYIDQPWVYDPNMTFQVIDGIPYVAGRPVAWASDIRNRDRDIVMPDVTWRWQERGFHCMTENGFRVSTQWGTGNYCVNYRTYETPGTFTEQSPDAEMAVFDGKDNLMRFPDGDSVMGWVPAGLWWELLRIVSQMPSAARVVPFVVVRDPQVFHDN